MSRGDAVAGVDMVIGPASPLCAQTMRGPIASTCERNASPTSSSRNHPGVPGPRPTDGGSHSVYTFHPAGRRADDHSTMRSSSAWFTTPPDEFGCTMAWVSRRCVPA